MLQVFGTATRKPRSCGADLPRNRWYGVAQTPASSHSPPACEAAPLAFWPIHPYTTIAAGLLSQVA